MTERILHLLLVDADEVFRLGLRVWLEQFSDLQVAADVASQAAALQILVDQPSPIPETEMAAESPAESLLPPHPDLVILDLDLGDPDGAQGLSLCQQIKSLQATLPILLLTQHQEIPLLAAAFKLGVEGYCLKGIAVTELVAAIRQVTGGQKYWSPDLQTRILATQAVDPEGLQQQAQGQVLDPQETRLWSGVRLRYFLWRSGIAEIDAALVILNAQLQVPSLSWLERAVLTGRRREVLAARWLVNFLLAPATPEPPSTNQGIMVAEAIPIPEPVIGMALGPGESGLAQSPSSVNLASQPFQTLKATLFEATFSKLQSGLQNLTGKPLEIDILRRDKKRELFYIILRQLEEILDDLRFSQVTPLQIPEKRDRILLDLWRSATTEFFGKYYTLRLQTQDSEVNPRPLGGGTREDDVELVAVLLRDAEVVRSAILDQIPFVGEWLEHLLFQTPLIVENRAYAAGSRPATSQAEAILQNLLVQVGNGVIQPLLNHFADVEVIKQTFYDRRLISTRELERFRNALSWNYRLRRYLEEPTHIFESQFRLVVFSDRGLEPKTLYAPRDRELRDLSGLRLAVTLALEVRDTVAPPLRSTVAFFGKGAVYLLTQVVGRGIGLIGRGILQGIGSSWQDLRKRPQK